MYLKSQTIRKPNGKSYTYFRLVEAYREGGKVKHRILAELGSLTHAEAAKLARRFAGIAGLEISDAGDVVEVNGSKYFGAPLLVEQLVEILGLDRCLQRATEKRRIGFDVVEVVKVMLCAHLFKSDSRAELAVWDWQQKLFWHPHRVADLAYHQMLRALSLLVDLQEEVEEHLFFRLVDLFSIQVDVVFYDLTSTYVEGQAEWSERLQRGYSRDNRGDCKQLVLGLVVTREGFPVTCRVFDGKTLDKATLREMVAGLQKRFSVGRCLWVSDTGLLTEGNLQALEGSGYEYILGAGNGSRKDVQAAFAQTHRSADGVYKDLNWWSTTLPEVFPGTPLPKRLVVLESEGRKAKTTAILERRLQKVRDGFAKLERQAGQGKGRTQEDVRTAAEKVLYRSGVMKYFSYEAGDKAFHWQEATEAVEARKREAGKYALLAKTDLAGEEVIGAYRTLLAAEDAFRVVKDELALRPLWHKCDTNVEGHVLLAMWSYLLHKTLEVKLEEAQVDLTPARALQAIKEVKAVEVAVRERPIWKLMKVSREAEQGFAALGIDNLKGRFHQWAEGAAPYHYEPRLSPYPESED